MTNEKIYSQCCQVLAAYAAEVGHDAGALFRLFEKDPDAAACSTIFPVLAALAPIMQAAREGMDKETTSAGTLAALKRIAKTATKDNFRGYWIDGKGRACICSGYHAVRIQDAKFDSIPTVPAWDGIEEAMKRPGSGLYEIQPPTVADCKAFRASHDKRAPMPIDEGRRWVSSAYMLDLLQALPGAKVYATDNALAPLWFESDKGDGILLPCRPPKK